MYSYIMVMNDGEAFEVKAADAYATRADCGVIFVDENEKTLSIVYDIQRVTRVPTQPDLKVVK